MSSQPSPFISIEQEQASKEATLNIAKQKLKEEQLENEEIFRQLNNERLLELEKNDNDNIAKETRKEFNVNDKSLGYFLGGFSKTILGVINDVLYKLSNKDDTNFNWSDILTTEDRIMYIGILLVIISVFVGIAN